MLYDRPYMQATSAPESGERSVVTTLLIVTVGVFVLQHLFNILFPGAGGRPNAFFRDWFALSGETFRDLKVWTIVSYTFLHSTVMLFHILGNMLGLFFIGRAIEPLLTRNQFLVLYFGGAFIGGLAYLLLHYNGEVPVMGASASVFALLAFFCLLRPNQPITLLLFFVLPVTVKPKWVFWGSLAISGFGLLFYELGSTGSRGTVAHSAHLGGMLGGILFFRYIYQVPARFGPSISRPSVEPPEWFKKKVKTKSQISYKVNRTSRKELQKEVDRILDKINVSGFGSLTDEEKTTLDQARNILSR